MVVTDRLPSVMKYADRRSQSEKPEHKLGFWRLSMFMQKWADLFGT